MDVWHIVHVDLMNASCECSLKNILDWDIQKQTKRMAR